MLNFYAGHLTYLTASRRWYTAADGTCKQSPGSVCDSNSTCDSGSCRGGQCCAVGVSEGCSSCQGPRGTCSACSAAYYLRPAQSVCALRTPGAPQCQALYITSVPVDVGAPTSVLPPCFNKLPLNSSRSGIPEYQYLHWLQQNMERVAALQLFTRAEDKGPSAPTALAVTPPPGSYFIYLAVVTSVISSLDPELGHDSIVGNVGNRDAALRDLDSLPHHWSFFSGTTRASALLALTVEGRTGVVVVTSTAIAVYALDANRFESNGEVQFNPLFATQVVVSPSGGDDSSSDDSSGSLEFAGGSSFYVSRERSEGTSTSNGGSSNVDGSSSNYGGSSSDYWPQDPPPNDGGVFCTVLLWDQDAQEDVLCSTPTGGINWLWGGPNSKPSTLISWPVCGEGGVVTAMAGVPLGSTASEDAILPWLVIGCASGPLGPFSLRAVSYADVGADGGQEVAHILASEVSSLVQSTQDHGSRVRVGVVCHGVCVAVGVGGGSGRLGTDYSVTHTHILAGVCDTRGTALSGSFVCSNESNCQTRGDRRGACAGGEAAFMCFGNSNLSLLHRRRLARSSRT